MGVESGQCPRSVAAEKRFKEVEAAQKRVEFEANFDHFLVEEFLRVALSVVKVLGVDQLGVQDVLVDLADQLLTRQFRNRRPFVAFCSAFLQSCMFVLEQMLHALDTEVRLPLVNLQQGVQVGAA